MHTFLKKVVALFLIGAGLFLTVPLSAQKPLWVDKGVKSLDKKRSNDSYYFKAFNTYGIDADRLKAERFNPLLTDVRERYGADYRLMTLDSLRLDIDTLTTYRITFTDSLGTAGTVYARRVDEYFAFEDYVNNTYQYEYYQLYAVSERDSIPLFDDFELTRTYNSVALALSIIPGMGQLYKGQKAKGYAFLGLEATLVTSVAAFQIKKHYCGRKADENPGDSWKSKERGWRQMRNLSICAAGGLYVYNLIDAAFFKGHRHVLVKKKESQLFITPSAFLEGAGMTFTYNF